MSDFHRQRLTLEQAMQLARLPMHLASHITYDPHLKPQYRIRRGTKHDGTLIFTIEVMRIALQNLIERTSYYKPHGEPTGPMEYTVGPIYLFCVYGMVDLPIGRYPGQRERVVIPVVAREVTSSLAHTSEP